MIKLPEPGDPLPWIDVPTTREEMLPFKGLAGHPVILSCVGAEIGIAEIREALERSAPGLDRHSAYWLVIASPSDVVDGPVPRNPRARLILDRDGEVRKALGLPKAETQDGVFSLDTDPSLRVTTTVHHHGPDALVTTEDWLTRRLEARFGQRVDIDAPVLLIPDVIEKELRDSLIEAWESGAPEESGYLRANDDGGVTHVVNPGRKRRSDLFLEDTDPLAARVHARIRDRVAPWLRRATHFKIGFAERYRIACYDSDTAGFFAPHRDFTETSAHRHFAMTIALNDGYLGGGLRFPEFGTREYALCPGQAIVYSGSLLHEVTPMTRGRRFALINFLTNGEGAKKVKDYQREHGAAPEHKTAG